MTTGQTTYQAYPAYKDSGVDWLGDVPEHWEVKRLKFVAPIIKTKLNDKPDEMSYIALEHIKSNTGRLTNNEESQTVESSVSVFRQGDVLFGKLRPYLNKVIHVQSDGACSSELVIFRTRENTSSRYLFYTMLSKAFVDTVNAAAYGVKMPRATPEQIGNMRVSILSLPEQQAIADFLDRRTEEIDDLIAKKEQLIELLREKRTALISHAVTKGLNPDVKMKDSGIDWLGEIPEHWEGMSLKRWVKIKITDGPHETPKLVDDGIPFVSAEAVRNGKINFDAIRGYISHDLHKQYIKKCYPRKNDIFMIKSGATTGNLALVDTDCEFSIWSPLALIRANEKKILPKYLFFSLHADYVQNQVQTLWSFGTQQNIGMGIIERLYVIAPSVKEQHIIVSHLDRETSKIDALIAKVTEAIEKLKEYRIALISAAVTGKIDVREEIN